LDQKVERTAVEAARRKFSPEFMNRLDRVVVFHSLQRHQLEQVLDIELGQVQQRVWESAKEHFLFRVTSAGREFLLQEGTDPRYGARHLKRAIERHLVYPIANLLATAQVHLGDAVCIDWDYRQDRLIFIREGEDLAMAALRLEPAALVRSAPVRMGSACLTLVPEGTPCAAR
jgi:ATP-dependent Clp protease ATP-binding subunit ClpA